MVKKSLLMFLVIALGVFSLSISEAVTVNPGDTGDALIYGYYNARGSWNYIRVINTSETTGVAAKVRFREGKNSNEVLDFFICLSAGDQWSGWVIDDGNADHPGTLYWFDNDTPTYPDPNGNNVVTDNFLAGVPFAYSATGAAPIVSANMTKEGYLEIIGVSAWADTPGPAKIVKTPNACGETILGTATVDEANFTPPTLSDVPNTLMGNLYTFNLADGAGTYAYNATALADFRATIVATPGLGTDDPPRLSDCDTGGLVAVNQVLTKSVEYAIYDVSSLLGGATDIINTFPTKRLSIELDPGALPNGPFDDSAVIDADGAIGDETARCESVTILPWDDAENTPGATIGFSPSKPTVKKKCDEVNVIVVGTGTSLLNSNLVQFNITNAFDLGWVAIDLQGAGRFSGSASGLPVISYEMQGFIGGYWTHMLPLRYVVLTPG